MSGIPGDPVSILIAASLVREDAPWLYELAMEVYRAVKSGDWGAIEREVARLDRFSGTHNARAIYGRVRIRRKGLRLLCF